MPMMVVLLFCLLSTGINVHRIIPEGSCPLCKMTNDKFLSAIIAVPPSFEVDFHGRLDSEVQKFIFVFARLGVLSAKILLLRGVSSEHLFQSGKLSLSPFRLESYRTVGGIFFPSRNP